MPQDSTHPQYAYYAPMWRRCADALAGTDAVKAAGEAYLPRPSGMELRDYQVYKMRAAWFGGAARVHQGLLGLIFREPPEVQAPARLLDSLQDVTGTGMALETFTQHVVAEHLTSGRVGSLVDLAGVDVPAGAVAPHWTLYRAPQAINWWHTPTPQGRRAYSRVILEEEVDGPDPFHPNDSYAHATMRQWRELVLEAGIYTVRVWRKGSASGTDFILVDERIPLRRGVPLTFLPLALQNADSFEDVLSPPPLLDVVDLNFSHYRTNADFKHSQHMTGMETPYITGHTATEDVFPIGPLKAWVIPEPTARVGMLGPDAKGLASMAESMQADQDRMAVLGARLIEPQRRAVESAETHGIRQSAELSIMEAYADAASRMLSQILRWHAWWAGVTENPNDETIRVTLNTTFLPTTFDAPMLSALVASWQAGALTQADLYYNLTAAGLLEPGVPFPVWQARIRDEGMLALLAPPVLPSADPVSAGAGTNGRG